MGKSKPPRILVVDDEPRYCQSIILLLAELGLGVDTARDGVEALMAMGRETFDLFLLDLCLPDLDGFALMAEAQRRGADTPIIVMTGFASTESAVRALKMGAFGYLKKPLEPEELKRSVSNALEQKRLRDENRIIAEKLRRSEQRYRELVQNSPDMIYILDRKGRFTFVNDTAEKMLGYRREELIGRSYRSLLIEADQDLPVEIHPGDRVVPLKRRDGSCCYVETSSSPITDPAGRPLGCRGTDRDISRRMNLEKALLGSCERLQKTEFATIIGLAKLAEYRDMSTGAHLERIQEYARVMAQALGDHPRYQGYITPAYVEDIRQSSILHDIGKVGVPDSILLKPGRLTVEEFEIIKRHSVIGGDAIRLMESRIAGQSFLTLGKEIAYYHHEKWDGSGYPFGLSGQNIPLSARLVAVADIYDALTSVRPYKEAMPHDEAVGIIVAGRGQHLDPDVVEAFLSREGEFHDIRYGQIMH